MLTKYRINVFVGAKSVEEFQSYCIYAHERVNPYLYIYAASVALLHRPDTRKVPLPSHVCIFPELYVDGTTLSAARTVGNVFRKGFRVCIMYLSRYCKLYYLNKYLQT